MSKKIKLVIDKVEYQLPVNSYVSKPTYGGEPYIHMSAKHTASIIKQFVKKFFPLVKVWSTSSVYSGGSSVDVNVSYSNGESICDDVFQKIESFSKQFKAGSFNGMEDIYEYNHNDVKTDNGTKLDYFPSYVFCSNKPKWGSVEYWLSEYNNWLENTGTEDWVNYDSMVQSAGGWLNMNKTYMTDKEFQKVESAFKTVI
tara:strand:+ start:68 stop:664 length:597 start_codon:yes stop_codon:yes gene_type:complete